MRKIQNNDKKIPQKNGQKLPEYTKRTKKKSKLDSYKDYLLLRMRRGVFNCQKLFDEVKKRGYSGGITILRDWIKPFREEEKRVPR